MQPTTLRGLSGVRRCLDEKTAVATHLIGIRRAYEARLPRIDRQDPSSVLSRPFRF